MKRCLVLLFFIALVGDARSQQLQWSEPLEVPSGGTFGITRPRVAVSNGVPVVVWSHSTLRTVYTSRLDNGVFTQPLLITPPGFQAYAANWTGPEMDARGDTVFVSFNNNTMSPAAYTVRSINGGVSFNDTVRVPYLAGDMPHYPAVAVLPGGHPVVSAMRFDSAFHNPVFTVSRSMDGGVSYQPYTVASAGIDGEACDCCPGAIAASGERVAVAFRNNALNIRDIWTTLSFDGGASFPATARVDSNDWLVFSCPASAPDVYLFGDTLVSVFMNGANGSRVFIASMDLSSMQVNAGRTIYNHGNQNYPRIAGSNDTLAVVWRQTVGSSNEILFSHSFNGPNGIGSTLDTLTLGLTGSQVYPDVALGGGRVHVVFENLALQKVYYMSAVLPVSLSNANVASGQTYFDVHQIGNRMTVLTEAVAAARIIKVYNALSQCVISHELPAGSTRAMLDAGTLPAGMYVLTIESPRSAAAKKMLWLR